MSTLKVPVSSDDHIQGSPNAPIVLIEYGDYQCPFCAKAHPIVKMLQKHYENKLCFVFRNFPLGESHPMAVPAAEAAEFAAEHNLFWQMHDLLFEQQANLSLPFILELGKTLGLPLQELEYAIMNRKYDPKIKNDFLWGVRSGVNGTPTFYINGNRYNGPLGFDELVLAIGSLSKG